MSELNNQDSKGLDSKLFYGDDSINDLIIEADNYSMATDDLYEKFTSSEITATEAEEQIIKTISNTTGLSDDIMDKLRVNKALPYIEDTTLLYSTTSALTGVDVEQFYNTPSQQGEFDPNEFKVSSNEQEMRDISQEEVKTQEVKQEIIQETQDERLSKELKDLSQPAIEPQSELVTSQEFHQEMTQEKVPNDILNNISEDINTETIDIKLDKIEDMLQDMSDMIQDMSDMATEGIDTEDININIEDTLIDKPSVDESSMSIESLEDISDKPLILSKDEYNSIEDDMTEYNLRPEEQEVGEINIGFNDIDEQLVNVIDIEENSSNSTDNIVEDDTTISTNLDIVHNQESVQDVHESIDLKIDMQSSDSTTISDQITESTHDIINNKKAVQAVTSQPTEELFTTLDTSLDLDANANSEVHNLTNTNDVPSSLQSTTLNNSKDDEPLGVIEDIPCQIKRVNEYVGEGVYSLRDDSDADIF